MKAELNLRTIVSPNPLKRSIAHDEQVLCLGSCFAEVIGVKMRNGGIQSLVNPPGICFNPVSLSSALQRLITAEVISQEELIQNNGLWHHWDFHSSFSSDSKERALQRINEAIKGGHEFLRKADHLVITLGTAWVHQLTQEQRIVSNCHKFPATQFTKRLLSPSEIEGSLGKVISEVRRMNNDIQIVFTLSPVRHWKDGAEENNLSKSTLRLAINELINQGEGMSYFPAFEILMDELRDYRFYAEDMLHPSSLAEDIIWARFKNVAFDSTCLTTIRQVEEIQNRRAHRSLFPDSEADRAFKAQLSQDIKTITEERPYLSFD